MKLPKEIELSTFFLWLEKQRKAGNNLTVEEGLAFKCPEYSGHAPEHRLHKFYHDLGFPYESTRVNDLTSSPNPDISKKLFKETVNSAIIKRVREHKKFKKMMAWVHPGKGLKASQPWIDLSKVKKTVGKNEEVEPGSNFKRDRVRAEMKSKSYRKFGKAIEITYEDMADVMLPVLSEFLGSYVSFINEELYEYCLDILINGDNAVDSNDQTITNPASAIGVETTGTFTQDDMDIPCMRMNRRGRGPNICVSGESETRNIRKFEVYKDWKYGGPEIRLSKDSDDTKLPDTLWVGEAIQSEKSLLFDSSSALGGHMRQGIMVENDQIIENQVYIFVVSMRFCAMTLHDDARCVLDYSKAFSSNGLPVTWSMDRK